MKFRPSDSVRQQCKGWCTFGKVLLSSKAAMLTTRWRFLHWNLFDSHPFYMQTIFKMFSMWDIRCLIHKWLEVKAIPNNNSVPIVCILLIASSTLCYVNSKNQKDKVLQICFYWVNHCYNFACWFSCQKFTCLEWIMCVDHKIRAYKETFMEIICSKIFACKDFQYK